MNSAKENQPHELMHSSTPVNCNTSSKSILNSQFKNIQIDLENNAKTATRFPPILKNKAEETPNLKQKETPSFLNLNKKISEEQNAAIIKRSNNNMKKKGQKKMNKLSEIKPEIQQKYRLYMDYLGLVNLSNNLKITVTEKMPNYIFYCGKGNNSSLIKHLFRNYRPWWTLEETNSENPNINLFWYQLRQNQILQSFKQNSKTQNDFENCDLYVEESEEKTQPKETGNREASSRSQHKTSAQIRSQSVTQKDIRITLKLGMTTKRSSSRTKGTSNEKISPLSHNFGKEFKEDIETDALNNKKKKVLANPKMWPIYHNYRKILSNLDLKQIKKLGVINQDGRILSKMSKNKVRNIENRSNYLRIHNHMANNWNLSNKKALFMNLKNYYDAQKINPFQYIPMTFHVTELTDKEFQEFEEEYNRRTEQIKEEEKIKKNQQFKHGFKPKKRNAWLVKPGENTNRGTGIEVVESLEEIKEIIEKEKVDKMGRPRTHIIQEYIMPFLYQKRKFDIRSYICVTSINGYQKGYWFQDGYIRTASKEFNMKNLNNKYIHLTNDAVQKYHEDYGKFQPANKLSFADFQRYLDTVYNSNNEGQKLKFYQQAYPEMKKLAADSIRSVFTKMDPSKKDFSFQIFGLDFLIDENFKVWLIEANTNPCLELACPLLGRVIPSMLESVFKLVIDPLFPPPPVHEIIAMSKKLVLPESLLENNKFQLIFDEVEEGKELRALLTNAPEVKIYDIEEEEEEYDENEGQCKEAKNLMVDSETTGY